MTRTEEITIQVPAGVIDGARMRVAGKGNAGRRDGPQGDLYITAKVSAHSLFRRRATTSACRCRSRCMRRPLALGSRFRQSTNRPVCGFRLVLSRASDFDSGLGERPRRGRDGGETCWSEVRVVVPPLNDERSKALLREFGEITRSISAEICSPSEPVMAAKRPTGKAYFMISAVAQRYNIHPQTLRLYEREGLLQPSRTDGNTRLYSQKTLSD